MKQHKKVSKSNFVYGKFYKYRSISNKNSKSFQYLKQLIFDQTIFFSNPHSFNDPFDCYPKVVIGRERDARRYAEQIANSRLHQGVYGAIPKKYLKNGVDSLVAKMKNQKFNNERLYKSIKKNVSVFCMSKSPTSIQQWSYYGDSHKGICLEFNCDKSSKDYSVVEVKYKNIRPVVNIIKYGQDKTYRISALSEIVSVKDKLWEHEDEVRALRIGEGGALKYPKKMLTGIIFGLNTTDSNKELIREWAKEANLKLNYRQIISDNSKYKLICAET